MNNCFIKYSTKIAPFLFVIGLFLLLISPFFLTEGMFMDGLIYSGISKNLALDIGSFWNLHYTKYLWSEFNGHPPLAMGLLSIFFRIFGFSFYVEKIYSVMTFFIVGFILVLIWKEIKLPVKYSWMPLLLWIMTPLVFWGATNNMLENTMSIFVSLSVLFYLKGLNNYTLLFNIASGLSLFLAFLTKGFTGLYPLAFPFVYWICTRNMSFKKMLLSSLIILVVLCSSFIILFSLNEAAYNSINKYIDIQFVHSINNIKSVDYRVFILWRLIQEILPSIIIMAAFFLFGFFKNIINKDLWKSNNTNKLCLCFMLFGLCGVLPIMVSMKQSGFYILTTFPFFAISMGLAIEPIMEKIILSKKFKKILSLLSVIVFLTAIIINIINIGKIGRDNDVLSDIHSFIEIIPENEVISIDKKMSDHFALHGYLSRYKNINLDYLNSNEYLILENDMSQNDSSYRLIKKGVVYNLYKRNE